VVLRMGGSGSRDGNKSGLIFGWKGGKALGMGWRGRRAW
jgi:hypothetical protein